MYPATHVRTETDLVSETSCFPVLQTMDNFQKPSNSESCILQYPFNPFRFQCCSEAFIFQLNSEVTGKMYEDISASSADSVPVLHVIIRKYEKCLYPIVTLWRILEVRFPNEPVWRENYILENFHSIAQNTFSACDDLCKPHIYFLTHTHARTHTHTHIYIYIYMWGIMSISYRTYTTGSV
jgi:hypothetical protein